jgi:CRP-like cAMP-binding protein
MMRKLLSFTTHSPTHSKASSISDIRRSKNRQLTIADAYEFFKRPLQRRKAFEIDAIAKLLCELIGYFRTMRKEQDFVMVKECTTYMQYEYSPPARVRPTQYLFKQGEDADRFYVILEGSVGVHILKIDPDDKAAPERVLEVAEIHKGNAFGDYALLHNERRSASIYVKENSHFLVLYKKEFLHILGKVEAYKLKEKVDFLRSLPLFQRWANKRLIKTSYAFDVRTHTRNHFLFKEGDPTDFIYIVKEGEFQLLKNYKVSKTVMMIKKIRNSPVVKHKTKQIQMSIAAKGQMLGEDDFINDQPHSNSCKCLSEEGVLLEISVKDFKKRIVNRETLRIMRESTAIRVTDREKRMQDYKAFQLSGTNSESSSPPRAAKIDYQYGSLTKPFSNLGHVRSSRDLLTLSKTFDNTTTRSLSAVRSFDVNIKETSTFEASRRAELPKTERKFSRPRVSQFERQFERHRASLNLKGSQEISLLKKIFPFVRQGMTRATGGIRLHSVQEGLVIRSQSRERS